MQPTLFEAVAVFGLLLIGFAVVVGLWRLGHWVNCRHARR